VSPFFSSRILFRFSPLVLGICLLTPATSQVPNSGPTNDQVKQSILNCSLFRSSDIFYPKEQFGRDRPYSEMTAKEKDDLRLQVERILEVAYTIYLANAKKMSIYLGDRLPASLPAAIVTVVDEGSHKLEVEPSEDSQGKEVIRIAIDVKLMQDSFKAGVVAAFKGRELLNPLNENGLGFEPGNTRAGGDVTDEQLVTRFLEIKKKIRRDLSKKLDSLQISMRSLAVMTVDSRYTGILLFGMAHEIAHYILKHSSTQDYPECTIFKTEELKADMFASFLLARALSSRGVLALELVNQSTGFFNYTGSEVFLREGYERFGIDDTGQASPVCRHPLRDERLVATQSAMTAAIEASKRDEDDAALSALEKRIQTIQSKNLRRKKRNQ
jgi:hypothetical protein